MSISITVNGKNEMLDAEMTIIDYLQHKTLRPEVVTVEVNDSIVQKEQFATTNIKNSDRIELVFFMGGGL